MKAFEFDRKIEAIARRQHGAISRAQVFAAGGSDRIVHRRLAEGSWSRPISGVYVLRWSSGTWLRQCKIAELSVPGSAVAGHSAAALHELDGFRRGHIELVSAPNSSQRHPFATVHRYAGALTTKVHGITVTSIAQTAFDLAISTRPWKLERAIDTAIQGRKLRVGELEERNHFYEGSRRPGLPRIRPLVQERTGDGWQPVESELEAIALDVLRRVPSAPRILVQAPVPWFAAMPGRVDFLLPDQRIVIEADGRRWHTRIADFDRDRWRDNQADAHDHRVMRFTWVHLNHFVDDVVEIVDQAVTGRAAA